MLKKLEDILKRYEFLSEKLSDAEVIADMSTWQKYSKEQADLNWENPKVREEMKGVVDFSAERERLQKELASLEKNLAGYAAKLSNPNFVERAPAKVVEEEKKRQAEALENKAKVEEALERIANL